MANAEPSLILSDLSPDLLRLVYNKVANPLAPLAAISFGSTCKSLRAAVRSRAAPHDRSAEERLRRQFVRVTVFARATEFVAVDFRSGEALTFGELMTSGWINQLQKVKLRGLDRAPENQAVEPPPWGFADELREHGETRHLRLPLRFPNPETEEAQCATEVMWWEVFRTAAEDDYRLGPIIRALTGGALPRLLHLDFGDNKLGDSFCVGLSAALSACTALQELYLDRNGITGHGVAALAGALGAGAAPHLRILGMRDNFIDDAGLGALAESGKQGLQRLEVLLVDYYLDLESGAPQSGLSASGFNTLAAALRDGAFPALIYLAAGSLDGGELVQLNSACDTRSIRRDFVIEEELEVLRCGVCGEEGEETGWEYLCKWEGDWEDSWVRHDEMGTTEPRWNGSTCKVVSFDRERRRYTVQMKDESTHLALKLESLRL
ncbi:hypothetical protein EMIHUDRAFT_111255 [Emiliania huxleyi CCMP1516]|uniref:F-box domain-containing protein n=2 Tax=Emiliania huxleyi TaxID=2903 RepID=A0A0D3KFN8_EMIH1|nr:hypothetical protein EMIHUDRAFT_111255 [Emiliania huxleyi CCMP1516]EOD34573.1 hypothetical protein EMIHUDRAFT_111255 [Emiliania huxleyi CCMP1516]|eukprot:XP_005787002.1 hypothetical protein EMIHUDRAFT_111255 [Emiliania huxleyi CCMP1516]